ncbi:MAG: hypothetical protein ACYC26_05470 [Phycisphaerales bacterium]
MLTRFVGIGTGFVVGLIGVFCFAATSFGGAPLADRLPDDAIIYIGWAGSSKLGPGYEQSHMKALIGKSDLKALAAQVCKRFIKPIFCGVAGDAKLWGWKISITTVR